MNVSGFGFIEGNRTAEDLANSAGRIFFRTSQHYVSEIMEVRADTFDEFYDAHHDIHAELKRVSRRSVGRT